MTDYEIEELESQINKACFVPVFKNGANIGYRIESDPRRIAEHLELQGYRKEAEVAKEILDRLEKYICAGTNDGLFESYVRGLFTLERKHFGLEVNDD